MTIAQKLPLARTLTRSMRTQINDALQRSGQALPCSIVSVQSSGIVTVNFEVNSAFSLPKITIPVYGFEYIRYPIQKGDKGFTVPADASLAGTSGLGSGVSDLSEPGNLGALVFLPCGSAKWFATPDPNALVLYGPNGVQLRDTHNITNMTMLPTNITIVTPNGIVITAEQYNNGSVGVSENVTVGNGASGTFTTPQGQTVTVQDGIVTNIY